MTLPRRLAAVTIGCTLAALATVPGAAFGGAVRAEPAVAVSGLEADAGVVRFLLTASDLPSGVSVDPAKVTVTVGETALRAEAARVSRSATKLPPRAIMVVLDVSGSVAGARLEAARSAARELAQALPEDVAAGLIAVNDTATVRLQPTADRAALNAATDGLSGDGNTALYDAVALAETTLTAAGFDAASERRVLVLSDGLDTASKLKLNELTGRLTSAKLAVDVVAFQANNAGLDALQAIAGAANGKVLTAPDAAFVTQAFRAVAGGFSVVLSVEAAVPAELAGQQQSLVVSLDLGDQVLTASAPVTFATAPTAPAAAQPRLGWVPAWSMWALGAVLAAAAVVLVLLLLWPARRQPGSTSTGHVPPENPLGVRQPSSGVARTALAASEALVRSRGLDSRIALSLEQAGMRLRPHEWVLLRAAVAVTGGAVLSIVKPPWGAVFGLLLGWVGTGVYRAVRADKRSTTFAEQLPDGLQLVIGSLRSGFSFPQALDAMVRESPMPLAEEFGRALAEHRLGGDLSDSLEAAAKRARSDDLAWAVLAVRIQRDVGGSLAEVLQTTVDTIRERGRLRRHVRALSAEGRLSGWVLVMLPIVLGAFMFTFRGEYLRPLYTEPIGFAFLLTGLALLTAGIFWMWRVVKVEV
jgi:tight adherence protein B